MSPLALKLTAVGALVPLAICLTAIGCGALLTGLRAARFSTLLSAWLWSLAVMLACGSVATAAALGVAPATLVPWQFVAAALTFCPTVAVLGAKRPQHVAWNLVVASLACIAALPALEMALLQRGQGLEVGDARGWFLWLLVVLTPLNYLATRHWFVSLLAMLGQVVLLSPHLPLVRLSAGTSPPLVATGLFAAAACLVAASIWRQREQTPPHDRLWLGFRDAFGLFWALRVQERMNAAAEQFSWPHVLTWQGFRRVSDGSELAEIDSSVAPQFQQTLRGLLRRFVSPDWIADRLKETVH